MWYAKSWTGGVCIAMVMTCLFSIAPMIARSAWCAESSLLTPDFRLHQPNYALERRGLDIAGDTLGNFYIAWLEGMRSGVGTDGRIIVTRVRHDGTVEANFIALDAVVNGEITQGFAIPARLQISPGGDHLALQYSRFFDYPLPKGATRTELGALPNYEYCFLRVFDSAGAYSLPEVWVDSLQPGIKAYTNGVAFFNTGFAGVWTAESTQTGGSYVQNFDLVGSRIGGYSKVDSCTAFTCVGPQTKRMDSWHGGFVVAWDDLVLELGTGEQRPLFRIYDSVGQAISPVLAGAYESTYVADCGGSSPGYQSGYFPDVACAGNGEFMLVWASCDGLDFDPFGAKPWGQIYHADGTPKSGLVLLADTPNHDAIDIKVAWGDDGNYYAAWADARYSCATCFYPLDVFVQRVSPDGELIGHNYIINDIRQQVANGYDVDIAVSKGRACIIWRDFRHYPVPDNDGELYGQVVSLDLIGTYLHGDVNLDYQFTSADIIYLVNYVFKSGQSPMPGSQYGDVNGDCLTNAVDIIHYVNFVFKGGAALSEPCSN